MSTENFQKQFFLQFLVSNFYREIEFHFTVYWLQLYQNINAHFNDYKVHYKIQFSVYWLEFSLSIDYKHNPEIKFLSLLTSVSTKKISLSIDYKDNFPVLWLHCPSWDRISLSVAQVFENRTDPPSPSIPKYLHPRDFTYFFFFKFSFYDLFI